MNVARHYRPDDLDLVTHRPGDETRAFTNAVLLAHGSFIRTLEVEGVPVAVVGMQVRWAGVADVWAVVSDNARGHGLWLTHTCNRLLKQFAAELELRRISCSVKASQQENLRWMRVLGFVYEGCETAAGPLGEDLYRYVRWMTGPKNLH